MLHIRARGAARGRQAQLQVTTAARLSWHVGGSLKAGVTCRAMSLLASGIYMRACLVHPHVFFLEQAAVRLAGYLCLCKLFWSPW